MAMDFIKGCTTNLQLLAGIQKINVRQYTRSVTFAEPDGVLDTLGFLRQHNILGAAWHDGSNDNDIWVFLPAGQTELPAQVSERLTQWTLAIDELFGSETLKSGFDIDDILCGAVEGSLSFSLARSCGAMRLGCCKWAIPVREDAEAGNSWMLMSVGMRYVSDKGDGTLFFTTSVKPTSMFPVAEEEMWENVEVRLSPSAAKGRLLSGEEGPRVPAAFASTDWRDHVISACRAEGVELQEPADWAPVALDRGDNRYITWPSELCLGLASRQSHAVHHKEEWKKYFDSATDTGGMADALIKAEDFYNGSAQREEELANAQAASSREERGIPDAGQDLTSGPDMTSPPLLNRPDLQAVGGVYPTPPDGLQPGHPLHPQISSDSVTTTQPQPAVGSQDVAEQEDGEATEEARPRIPSIVSSVGAPTYQRRSSDDLFGDMDNVDFNGDEVGDADFSFFDEPDEMPMDANMPDAAGLPDDSAGMVKMEAETAAVEPLEQASVLADVDAQDDQASAPQEQTGAGVDDKIQEDAQDVQAGVSPQQHQMHEYGTVSAANTALPPSAIEEKPLSPFGIRERLLPPPIPASASYQTQNHESSRHRSSFGPLAFNTSLSIPTDRRYSAFEPGKDTGHVHGPSQPPPLPQKRKHSEDKPDAASDDEEDETITSSDSGNISADELTDGTSQGGPKGNSVSRKRNWDGSYVPQGPTGRDKAISVRRDPGLAAHSHVDIAPTLMELFNSAAPRDHSAQSASSKDKSSFGDSTTFDLFSPEAPNSMDLVMTAQIVAEQSVTCTDKIVGELEVFAMPRTSTLDGDASYAAAARTAADELPSLSNSIVSACTQALAALVPEIKSSDISSLALLKEAHVPPRPPSLATKGQPRPPPPRPDPTVSGPDITALNVPFIRIRRSDDSMDMLPTALHFWEALGLGPVSGPKDIRHFLIVPENEAVEIATDDFIEGIKTAYEGCKLGSHSEKVVVDGDEEFDALDSTRIVALDKESSFEDATTTYMHHCQAMGEQLAQIAFTEGVVTTVVYIVNPFSGAEARHHLCAAFWELCKTYRKGVDRARRSDKELQQRAPSDVVLQLLPLDMICAPGQMVIPTAAQMAMLAREIYDRCPPTSAALNHTSPLPIPAAPAVELAPPLAKRIGFQLVADAPVDLLHEASILHLAYATSDDGQWLSVAWTDNTGRYQNNVSFCLRGRSFADLATELWSRTMDILAARSVSWRVFITSSAAVSASEAACWRSVIRDGTERAQMLSVTLLRFHASVDLELSAPPTTDAAQQLGAGFLTPVSTPQQSGPVTVSPDASGQPATAPPTPAPSETAAAIAEQDPDACLVDVEDETFSVLLDPSIGKCAFLSSSDTPDQAIPLAYAALVKRGSPISSNLPIAGTSLLWTLRVRPVKAGSGCIIDEGSARHAEMMLREVAGMFRGLGLLGKHRGIDGVDGKGRGLVPVHVLVALRAVRGLEGMVG